MTKNLTKKNKKKRDSSINAFSGILRPWKCLKRPWECLWRPWKSLLSPLEGRKRVILRLENAWIGRENEYRGLESICRGTETDYRDSDSDCKSHEIAWRVSMGGKVGTGHESACRGRGSNIEAFKKMSWDFLKRPWECLKSLYEKASTGVESAWRGHGSSCKNLENGDRGREKD